MDYKKSGGAKADRNAPRHAEKGAKGGADNPFGPKKKAHEDDDGKNKTKFDKPATGEGDMAIDDQGPKNIRGPEGHGKEKHDRER